MVVNAGNLSPSPFGIVHRAFVFPENSDWHHHFVVSPSILKRLATTMRDPFGKSRATLRKWRGIFAEPRRIRGFFLRHSSFVIRHFRPPAVVSRHLLRYISGFPRGLGSGPCWLSGVRDSTVFVWQASKARIDRSTDDGPPTTDISQPKKVLSLSPWLTAI